MRLRKGKNAGKSNFWKVASNELWIVPKNKRSQQFGVFVNIWLFPRCSDYLAARVISKGEKAVPRHHFLPRVDSCAACLCKSCHLWSQRRWENHEKIREIAWCMFCLFYYWLNAVIWRVFGRYVLLNFSEKIMSDNIFLWILATNMRFWMFGNVNFLRSSK